MKNLRTRIGAVLASTLIVTSVAACSAPAETDDEGQPTEKVVLLIAAASPSPFSAYFQGGKEEGIFADNGIDLEFQYVSGGTTTVSALVAGQVDVVMSGAEPGVIASAEEGADIVSIAQLAYSNVYSWGFVPGSPVQKVADLKGARLGVASVSGSSIPVVESELAGVGLSLADVTLVPIGDGAQAVAAFQSGEVDAFFYYDTGFVLFKKAGLDFRQEALGERFVGQYPATVITTTGAKIEERGEVLTRFLQGLQSSIKWCLDDPEGCIDQFAKAAPDSAPDKELALEILKARIAYMELPAEANGQYGYSDESYWANLVDILTEGGLLTSDPDPSTLFTNDLLPPT
jgi:ABC-type nitrate/sulfonate/bicarbonate transport system substrate-binding protein